MKKLFPMISMLFVSLAPFAQANARSCDKNQVAAYVKSEETRFTDLAVNGQITIDEAQSLLKGLKRENEMIALRCGWVKPNIESVSFCSGIQNDISRFNMLRENNLITEEEYRSLLAGESSLEKIHGTICH